MEYILPDKNLLEKRSEELDDKKYFNLSQIFYKKDLDDKLVVPIGKDNTNEKYYINFEDKSGILISGETTSGKSNFINSIIISLLLKNTPEDINFIFIDPRNVEFNNYQKLPHTLKEIASNQYNSLYNLNYILDIIEERKKLSYQKLPHIFLFIDEASEILNIKNINEILSTILKEGKKYNIHLIMSTSSYFKDNLDKEILKLFNLVLTFDLASKEQADYLKIDGSNLLTIYGEAYIKAKSNIYDIQTPYVSQKDIENVTNFIINQTK